MGTIAAAVICAFRNEPISKLIYAGTTSSAGAAPLTNLLQGASAVIDHGFQVTIRRRMTEANQHEVNLIMLFKPKAVKLDFA